MDPRQPQRLAEPSRDVTWTSFAAFLSMGSTMLLVPALVRDVESAFGLTDASMGALYLVFNLAWVAGTVGVGTLVRWIRRPVLLGAGPLLAAVALAAMGLAGSVEVFGAGYVLMGIGLGVIDSGANALVMDLYRGREAGPLNRLHLWASAGAMAGPVIAGQLVAAGLDWRGVLLIGAAAIAPVGLGLATRRMPSAAAPEPAHAGGGTGPGRRSGIGLPVLVLSAAIATYVGMEAGLSNWTVRFLDHASLDVATLALSLFWGGMALSRLLSSFVANRLGPIRFAVTAGLVAALAILGAVAVPETGQKIALLALAGFAAGPIYPVIMAVGAAAAPGRTALVASVLATAGIVGSVIFPPVMGIVSEAAGPATAIAVAGAVGIVSAGATLAGALLASRRDAGEPVAGVP